MIETSDEEPMNHASVAAETEGYLASDLVDLVSRAIHLATVRMCEQGDGAKVRSLSLFFHWGFGLLMLRVLCVCGGGIDSIERERFYASLDRFRTARS
jgi:hypothetical protein